MVILQHVQYHLFYILCHRTRIFAFFWYFVAEKHNQKSSKSLIFETLKHGEKCYQLIKLVIKVERRYFEDNFCLSTKELTSPNSKVVDMCEILLSLNTYHLKYFIPISAFFHDFSSHSFTYYHLVTAFLELWRKVCYQNYYKMINTIIYYNCLKEKYI